MKQTLKKLLSMILSVVMVVGMMPAMVSAAETTVYKAVSVPTAGKQYVIAVKDTQPDQHKTNAVYALTTSENTGYENGNHYKYSGFDGVAVDVANGVLTGAISDDMLWSVTGEKAALTITNVKSGKQLSSTYENNSNNAKDGKLFLTESGHAWKYSESGQTLQDNSSTKYLAYDTNNAVANTDKFASGSGDAELITIRSTGDNVVFYEVSTSSEPSVPSEPEEKEAFAAVAPSEVTAGDYVVVSSDTEGEFALGNKEHAGYTNTNNYSYSGLNGVAVTVVNKKITTDVYASMVWTVAKNGSNLTLTNKKTGKALTASYENNTGKIGLGSTGATWSFNTDNKLVASSADGGKQLTYDSPTDHASKDTITSGEAGLFTVRSTGDVITLYAVNDGVVEEDPVVEEPKPEAFAAVAPSEVTAGDYVVVSSDAEGEFALGNKEHAGYTNTNNYSYSGLNGVAVTVVNKKITSDVYASMVWTVAKNGSNLTLTNKKTGKALTASYGNNTGKIGLGSTGATWSFNNDNKLVASSADGGKQLTYDSPADHKTSDTVNTGEAGLFTVRSTGDVITLYAVNDGVVKQDEDGDSDDEDPDSEGPVYLAFTSDVHNDLTKSEYSYERLDKWINSTSALLGNVTFDTMGFCGDTASGSGNMNGDKFWESVQPVLDTVAKNEHVNGEGIFVPGNHEWQNGSVGTSSNATAKKFKWNTAGPETAAYQIYCLGASSQNQSFSASDISYLDEYLKTASTKKPVIILSHFPLHSYGSGYQTRSTANADQMISTLNKYAQDHQIIFLWGHNHTLSDTNYDKVQTGKLGDTAIGFTYAAAGCMSDSEYSSGSNSVKGKGLVMKINGMKVEMTYYDMDNKVIATGTAVKPGEVVVPEEPDVPPVTDEQPVAGKKYLIVSGDGYALTTKAGTSYSNENGQYNYSGLAGTAYTKGMTATADMIWEVEAATGGKLYIKNGSDYLNGNYVTNNNNGNDGSLTLGSKNDTWTLSGSYLVSTNSSQTSKGNIYLTHANKNASANATVNTFSMRSADYRTTTTFVEYTETVVEPETVAVTGVTLNKTSVSLEAGSTAELTATVAPANATNKNVTWSTSDATVATVTAGKVTAVKAGTATITVTTVDGAKKATCTVTVTEKAPVDPDDSSEVIDESMGVPSITSVWASDATTTKLEWAKVNGATGYEIYLSTDPKADQAKHSTERADADKGQWARCKTIASADTLSYKVTFDDAQKFTTYYYIVRAYKTDAYDASKKTYSKFSEVNYVPATVELGDIYGKRWDNRSSETDEGFGVRLNWKAVDGADGYQIQRADAEHDFTVVKTMTPEMLKNWGHAYSNRELVAGKVYSYKIRAYYIVGKTADGKETRTYGAFSETFDVAVMPKAPVLEKCEAGNEGTVKLAWTQPDGVAGYQIWMKAPNADYAIVKTVKDPETVNYNVKKLDVGNYAFKIRAYTDVNGKKTFSEYSEEIVVRTK